jgi:hypothetical protein
LIILVLIFLLNFFYFANELFSFLNVNEMISTGTCSTKSIDAIILTDFVDLIVMVLLPFTIILVFNIKMGIRMFERKKRISNGNHWKPMLARFNRNQK